MIQRKPRPAKVTRARPDPPRHIEDLPESNLARVALESSRTGNALQILTGGLLEAQEEERKRIARYLHDGLNQELAMLAVDLGLLLRQVPREQSVLIETISDLRKRTESLSDDLRRLTHQLHPAVLENLGLVSALRSHCAEFTRYTQIPVSFTAEREMSPPADLAICLYRIVQEALRNVAKHSGADTVSVKIAQDPCGIVLSIVDNGCGFEVNEVRRKGLGLVSIQERVQAVKGQLTITSSPGKGTRIDVRVAVTWKEQRREHKRKYTAAAFDAG
jgi:signal transduction histidine kinase